MATFTILHDKRPGGSFQGIDPVGILHQCLQDLIDLVQQEDDRQDDERQDIAVVAKTGFAQYGREDDRRHHAQQTGDPHEPPDNGHRPPDPMGVPRPVGLTDIPDSALGQPHRREALHHLDGALVQALDAHTSRAQQDGDKLLLDDTDQDLVDLDPAEQGGGLEDTAVAGSLASFAHFFMIFEEVLSIHPFVHSTLPVQND